MRLTGWNLPFGHLSATSLSELVTCPEQFRRKRLLKQYDKTNLNRFIGSVVHSVTEENLRQKITTGQDMTISQVQSMIPYKWTETIDDDGEPEWEQHPDKVRELCGKMIETLNLRVVPTIKPVAVEEWFEEKIPGVPVPLVGRMDVKEGNLIRDFKTAAKKETKAKPGWRLQASIYQLVDPKDVAWVVTTKQVTPQVFTHFDEPGLLYKRGNPDQTVRMIQQAVEMLVDLYARYGADTPWPTNGWFHPWLCGYCSFITNCPAWKERLDPSTA